MTCLVCHGNDIHPFAAKNGCAVFRCASCGLLFVHPIPRSIDVYTEEYFSGAAGGFGYIDYDADKEPMVPVFKNYLTRITNALGKTGALLDVGAATGFFVRLAREAGFDAHGVELSDHAASLGRAKGLDIRTGTLSNIDGIFDCITMLDVIEHVPNPREELKNAHARLRESGVLIINTPDAGSLFARALGKRWHLIVPPEHLYYFNRKNLARLLLEEGFSVEHMTTIGKSFTLPYIFKMLHKWTRLSLFDWLACFFSTRFLARLALPINLSDNMFILARKK